ncbi:hypothetical protein CV102_22015 [Natronococcus pandeyae]|uniref:HMA domain-containing protein n=2 Tax=Natronococcus pandeyae TaxID=2055836 RepID=A0A8J8TNB9_9EURY|nr:heavy metal-associated domain-containing protein [Natronococcus pandeyae]TYL36501.1 hypothetical protein CV102_22015 [Natronococcus pandeyae]
MTCTTCASSIEERLEDVVGVEEASVNFGTERAEVRHDPDVSVDQFTDAVESAGYDVRDASVEDELAAEEADAERRDHRQLAIRA